MEVLHRTEPEENEFGRDIQRQESIGEGISCIIDILSQQNEEIDYYDGENGPYLSEQYLVGAIILRHLFT